MVSLRRKAQELGIEKIYLKGGKMTLFFIDESNRHFYESEMFGNIILYIATTQFNCSTRNANQRYVVTVNNVKSIETALAFIDEMREKALLPQ